MARTVQTAQGVISYNAVGTGAPLVLLPGFQSSSLSWVRYGYPEHLDGFHCIMIDPLGHGDSEKSYNHEDYGIRQTVGQITSVLDAEGIDRAPIVGFSRGGIIVAHMVDLAPERLSAAVMGGAALGRARSDILSMFGGLAALESGDWAAYWGSYPVALPSELTRRFEEANDPRANAAALRAQLGWSDENPSEGLGPSVVPRLAYFGTGEIFAKSLREELNERGIDYAERDWAGHAETMSDSMGVAAIVREFLKM